MGNIKKINLKNRTYYFFSDMINTKDFDSSLRKDFMKIRFELDDNLPFNKILKLHVFTVIIRSIFEEDDQYVFLDVCLDEV